MALVTPRTVFIHVPKTGGSTVRAMIEAALGADSCAESGPFDVEDHFGLPELRAAHPDLLAGRLTFGFVRHPVAWLKSRYAWAIATDFKSKMATRPDAAAHWMADCWADRFEDFVLHYLAIHPGVYSAQCFRMLGFWTERRVDFVGHTETLEFDLRQILERADESFDPAKLHMVDRKKVAASGKLKNFVWLSSTHERRIVEAERAMCEVFGYE
jgi:hypothetical protein